MAKRKVDEAEILATVEALPNKPTKVALAHAESFLKKSVIVYKTDKVYFPLEDRYRKGIRAYCSNCQQEFELEYEECVEGCAAGGYSRAVGFLDPTTGLPVQSYDKCECPWCDCMAEAVHVSKFKKDYQIDYAWVGEIHNIRGHLALLAWFLDRRIDKTGKVTTSVHQNEGIFIIEGTPYRVCGYRRNIIGISHRNEWIKYSKYSDSFGIWSCDEFVYDPSVIDGTDSANCGIHKFMQDSKKEFHPGAYLWLWCKCPAIENLVTSGNSDYVNAMIEKMTRTAGYYYEKQTFTIGEMKHYINSRRVKPHEMMRCEKADIKLWREMGIEKFAFRGYIYEKYGISLEREMIEKCYNEGLDAWYSIFQNHSGFLPPLMRTLHYVDKQKRRSIMDALKDKKLSKKRLEERIAEELDGMRRWNSVCKVSPLFLYDYWSMLYKVYGEFPEDRKYPKDLVQAHDEIQERVKEKESAELAAKFKRRFAELSQFSFENRALGLLIRPCETQTEMIEEGAYLHHCVGGYAQTHARGETSIFFIRRIEKPEVPYYTLELKRGHVAQNEGMKHVQKTKEVAAFEKEWLEYIEKIKTGEENGKHGSRSKAARAGA